MTSLLLAASDTSADGTSERDAAADDERSRSAWNLRRVTRYGVVRWIGALLHGKTRGSAHSDFELVNAAILRETRRQNATESGEQRKIVVEASPSASVLLETAPQVRRNRDSVAPHSFPVNEPNKRQRNCRSSARSLGCSSPGVVGPLMSRGGKHWHLYRSLVSRF